MPKSFRYCTACDHRDEDTTHRTCPQCGHPLALLQIADRVQPTTDPRQGVRLDRRAYPGKQ